MRNFPLISVIVPCYNVEKYVVECLESILSQTYENLDILVINDGSTDNTEEMIKPFLNDKRIRYYYQENKGLSEARNRGLNEMKIYGGDYVCFIDSDDFIHKDYIKILYENLVKYDADISICDFVYNIDGKIVEYDNDENEITISNREECMNLINKDVRYIIACSKLYKLSLFKDISFIPNKIHEDEFIAHHIMWRVEKVVKTNRKLYIYRKIENSITTSPFTNSRLLNIIEAFEDRERFFREKNIKNIQDIVYTKWNVIVYEKGILELNLTVAKNYILKNPYAFFTKFKHPMKKKIKLYFQLLLGFK